VATDALHDTHGGDDVTPGYVWCANPSRPTYSAISTGCPTLVWWHKKVAVQSFAYGFRKLP
jgi:hypothetical protein